MSPHDHIPPDSNTSEPQVSGSGDRKAAASARERDTSRSPWRTMRRWTLWGLGGFAGFLLVLVLVILLLLQTNWGTRTAVNALLPLANPFADATLTVDDIDGNWISHLELYGVTLTRADTVTMAHIDTVEVRYRLWSLFGKRIHLRDAYVAGPAITMRQQPDSTWDLLSFLSQDTTAADTTESAFLFQVDQARLRRGTLEARFHAPEHDSTLRVRGLTTRLDSLLLGRAMALRLDTLGAFVTPPGRTDSVAVATRLRLTDGRLVLDTLRLDSPASNVAAAGSLRLPTDARAEVHAIDLALDAEPLALGDVASFVPALASTGSAVLDVRVQGAASRLQATADARFSDGATLTLDALLTPAEADSVAYRLDGRGRRLDPAFFTGDPTMRGRINADVQADLQGFTLERLDGTARALVFDTRYAEYDLDRTTLRVRFDGGTAVVDLETGLRGTALALEGTMRPFAEPPTYNFQGRVRGFDVGRFTEGATQSSDVGGAFRLEGRGFDLLAADLTASLDLGASRFNRTRIQEGTLTARLRDGRLGFQTRLRFQEGYVAARGDARLADEPLRFRIQEGRFEDLDVAALTGDTTRSAFTGSFAVRGSGTDPSGDLRLDSLRLTLADSFYGPYRIEQARLDGTLRQGRLYVDAAAALEAGAFDLTATVRPFDGVPTFEVTSGRFERLDAGILTQNPGQHSDLTGTITRLAGRGFDPATMTLDVNVVLDPSRFNQQPIDGAEVTARLQRGTLDFEARLDTPGGRTALAGSGDLFGETPSFNLSRGSLDGLNLGALLGVPGLDTDLNGTIRTLDLRGNDPQTMTLRAEVDLDRSRINRATLVGGTAQVTLEDGLARAGADVDLTQGGAKVTATGRFFDERPTYEAVGTMDSVDVAALAGLDTLAIGFSADFGLQGEGFDPQTMTLQARLDAVEARYDSVLVNTLQARLRLQDGLLQVDTLALHANVARLQSQGQVALFDTLGRYPSELTIAAVLLDVHPLRSLLGADMLAAGEGRLEATFYGTDTLRFDTHAELNSLVYNDIRVAGFDLNAAGAFDRRRTLSVADARAAVDYFSVPALSIRYTEIEASFADDSVRFATEATIDQRRDARLRGAVDLRPDNRRVVLDDLVLHLDRDRWELLQPASIAYGDAYRVSNFLLFSEADNQQLAVDGVIDLDGRQSLVLTLEQFRIGAIADLFNLRGLGGTLNGYLDLTGPATGPVLGGTLTLDVESFDQPVGDLRLDVRYDSLRLNLDAALTHEDQSTLSTQGYLPMDLRLSQGADADRRVQITRQQADPASTVSLRIDANRFNIGWIEPFLDPELVNEVEGRLTADIDVSGTLESPDLAGEAFLQEGRLRMPELGVTYTGISADAELEADKILLNHAEMRSGNGEVIAHGTIDFPQLTLGEFNIEASAENFRAINSRAYRAVVAGDVVLRGTTKSPRLEGTVKIESADIYLTEETSADSFEPVELTERDLQMLERHFGIRVTEADTSTFDFYQALTMDLRVQMDRDVWLRSPKNPEMNIQFTGSLDLEKVPYEEQQLFGTIEILPERSFINQFGRRFNVSGNAPQSEEVNNTLTFNGPTTDPQLSLAAAYDVRSRGNQGNEITIWLIVTGRLEDLKLTLTSQPETDYTNIVSYLATGRPASEAFQLGGGTNGGLLGQGAELAIGQLTNIVESAAGSELGLDVIEIRQEGLQGTTITAGKYLSGRFYAAVSWPISFNNTSQDAGASSSSNREFTIEYELFNWLLARVVSNGTTVRFNLLYEYAY